MWQYAIPAAIQLASGLFGEDEDKSKQTSTSKTTYS